MSNTVNQTEFINYISEFKKIFVTKVNSPVTQLFKIDSNISDQYYFQILNKNNQVVSLTGRTFQIYGSIVDAKDVTHILFYTPSGTVENNNILHFHINTYNQQYLAQIKTTKQANVTIVETTNGNTQVVLRDVGLFYKRPYVDNQIPAEVYTVRILTGSLPWENQFGAGQNINLIEGTPNYAFGSNLSTASNQFVIGDTNTPDATKAFIVANSGNVFTVDYQGNVEAKSLTVNGSQVATATDLTGFATEQYVDAAVSGKADLSSVYTKENVYPAWTTDQLIEAATSGKADKSELADYATKVDLATTSATLEAKIPTYTAGSGISISNQNVISIDGELGKTYYADDTTLQLNNATNTFSVKSIRSKLAAGSGVMLSEDTSTGVTTINLFGGGSGGGAVQYFEGTGIKINDYYISVDADWLSQQIEAATQDLQNLSAGTGLKIEDNVISLTATIPSVEGLASEEWVEQNFLSSIPANYVTSAQLTGALNDYAKTTDLANYVTSDTLNDYVTNQQLEAKEYATTGLVDSVSTTIVNSLTGYAETSDLEAVSGELNNAISARALETDLQIVSTAVDLKADASALNDYAPTSSLTAYQLKSDVIEYTAGSGLALSDNEFRLTATIPSIDGLASEQYVDQKTENMATTGYVTGYCSAFITEADIPSTDITKVSQLENDSQFITLASVDSAIDDLSAVISTNYATTGQIPDTSNLATKTELSQTSTAIINLIPEVSGKADLSAVEAVDAKFANYSTSEQIAATYATKNEIPSLTAYATTGYVDSAVSGKADLSALNVLATKSEVQAVDDKFANYTTTTDIASTYATKNEIPVVTAFITSGDAKTQIEAYNYVTETALGTTLEDYALKSELPSIEGLATEADLQIVSSALDNYVTTDTLTTGYDTSSEVDDKITAAIADIDFPEGVNYTAGEGLGLSSTQNGKEFYLTAQIPSIDGLATEADLQAVSAVVSTLPNTEDLTGAIDAAVSGKADKSELDNLASEEFVNGQINDLSTVISSNYALTSEIPDTSNLATKAELSAVDTKVDDVSAVVSAKADKSYVDETFLSAIPDEYVTATELATELQPYALSANVDTSIAAATGVVTSWVDEKGYLTAHQDLTNYATNDNVTAASANAVNVATGWVAEQDYLTAHQSLNGYATEQWVEDKGYITGIANNALLSDINSAINDLSAVISTNYLTGVDLTSYAQTSTVNSQFEATSGWVTNTVSANLQTAINGKADSSAIPTAVSQLTNDSNFISAIVVKDDIQESINASGLVFDSGNFTLTDSGNDTASISWNGLNIEDVGQYSSVKFSDQFTLSDVSDSYLQIEIADGVIPDTSNFATTGYVTGAISGKANTADVYSITSADNTFLKIANYVAPTAYTAGSGLALSGNEFRLTATIPSVDGLASQQFVTGQIEDLSGVISTDYALKSEIPTTTINTLTGNVEFLSGAITGVANDLSSNYLKTVDYNEYTDSDVATYLTTNDYVTSATVSTALSATSAAIEADIPTAASELDDYNTLALKSELPSVEGLATTGYVTGAINDVVTGQINPLTGRVDTLENAGYITDSALVGYAQTSYVDTVSANIVTGDIVNAINDLSGVISTDYATTEQVEYISSVVSTLPTTDTTYQAGYGLALSTDNTFVLTAETGGGAADPTNQQTISTGFTYSSGLQIAKNTYTPTDNVITLSAFEVPAGTLGANQVATFEEWVYTSGTMTGFAFDGVTLIGEIPSGINQTKYCVFTRRILGNGEQLISFAYCDNDYKNIPLTFKGLSSSNAVVLTSYVLDGGPNAITLQYSKNNGVWDTYQPGTTINLDKDETVAFKGPNNLFSKSTWDIWYFKMSGTIESEGNIQSLMNFSNSCADYCYAHLFWNCTSLVKSPRFFATTLAPYCYTSVFQGCSSLTAGPSILPATTLVNGCYSNMFYTCTSLIKAPTLPATTLASQSYEYMYSGCSSLISISVALTGWGNNGVDTKAWVERVKGAGQFHCPSSLGTIYNMTRDRSHCPSGFTVVNDIE